MFIQKIDNRGKVIASSKTLKNCGFLLLAMSMLPNTLWAAEKQGTVQATAVAYEKVGEENVKSGYVIEGETVTILEELEGYYKVELQDSTVSFIEKESIGAIVEIEEAVVEEKAPEVKVEPKAEVKAAPAKSKGEEIVAYAKEFLGTPYVSGGNSLTRGVDCSGFTSQVFKNFGISLQRSSRDQYASNGTKVSRDSLQIGDLVFYGYNGRVSHVGIYAGNSNIVHASTSDRGVVVDPMTQRGMLPIIGYKRVINQ